MFAIVEIAGRQYKVEPNQRVKVNRLSANEGDSVTFDKVVLLSNEGATTIGTPTVSGASVSATVDKHAKGDKVIVFKKKRRKGYAVKNGHRHFITCLTINSINA